MEMKNGPSRAATMPWVDLGRVRDRLSTKGVTVAFAHPTPRSGELAWRCEGHEDPEIFDPRDDEALAAAQELCGTCEVKSLCLSLGLSRDEWGVWGGVLLEDGKPIDKVKRHGRPAKVAVA